MADDKLEQDLEKKNMEQSLRGSPKDPDYHRKMEELQRENMNIGQQIWNEQFRKEEESRRYLNKK